MSSINLMTRDLRKNAQTPDELAPETIGPKPLPDPEPDDQRPILRRSLNVQVNDGTTKSFPTLDDYVAQLVANGVIRDKVDLIRNYEQLVWEIFFNWISTGQTACLFAAKLAGKPRPARWVPFVELDALSTPDLGDVLNTRLDAASNCHEAVMFIFPDIGTPEGVVDLVNRLCSNQRWYCTNDRLEPAPEDTCLVGLRWILPSDKSVNHVLGFAPFSTMPLTRRGPFVGLVLRIGDRLRARPPRKLENGRVQVHLADMDSLTPRQERHDQMWEQTEANKDLYVEPELALAAKAHVTFSLPLELNCHLVEPKSVIIVEEQAP
ncbi:MAG: hypothetical protein IH983_09945 [Planctomycetes bacterium]|nr:hypothetical protein [Planctomycetota bacterium]